MFDFFSSIFDSIKDLFEDDDKPARVNKSSSSDKGSINLKNWKIQLPVNSDGKLSGSMASYPADKSRKPYYEIDGDKLHFYNPGKGATSGNSRNSRCELAQSSNWAKSTLSYNLTMHSGEGRAVVTQIWSDDESNPLFGLVYDFDAKKMDFTLWNKKRVRSYKKFKTFPSLGKKFPVKITHDGKQVTVTVNGETQKLNIDPGMGDDFKWKFGVYVGKAKTTVDKPIVG